MKKVIALSFFLSASSPHADLDHLHDGMDEELEMLTMKKLNDLNW